MDSSIVEPEVLSLWIERAPRAFRAHPSQAISRRRDLAERKASAGFLDRATSRRLSVKRPALALALLSSIIRVQGERLNFATRQAVAPRRQ